jgi:hypothetical protein
MQERRLSSREGNIRQLSTDAHHLIPEIVCMDAEVRPYAGKILICI